MIDKDKYVPILKGKYGEFTALSKLDNEIKQNIIPIVDLLQFVPQVVKDLKKKEKPFDDYVNTIIKYFNDMWEKERSIYIDFYLFDNDKKMRDGTHPINYIFGSLLKEEYNVIPVLHSSLNEKTKNIIVNLISQIKKGACLRIPIDSKTELNTKIDKLLKDFDQKPTNIDLVLDLQNPTFPSFTKLTEFVENKINELKYIEEWRSLILSGSIFPIDLSKIKADIVEPIPRSIWLLWNELQKRNKLPRIPTFSDYCISHFLMSKTTGIPNASASIRYTHEKNFYIYRGRGTRERGYKQFFDVSESLINGSHFYGIEHCKGCEFIHKCGTKKDKPGSLTTWRWVGTAHHITVVVNQLRQFFRDLSA